MEITSSEQIEVNKTKMCKVGLPYESFSPANVIKGSKLEKFLLHYYNNAKVLARSMEKCVVILKGIRPSYVTSIGCEILKGYLHQNNNKGLLRYQRLDTLLYDFENRQEEDCDYKTHLNRLDILFIDGFNPGVNFNAYLDSVLSRIINCRKDMRYLTVLGCTEHADQILDAGSTKYALMERFVTVDIDE